MDDSLSGISKALRAGQISSEHLDLAETLRKDSERASLLFPATADDDTLKQDYQTAMLKMIEQISLLEAEMENVLSQGEPQDLDATISLWKSIQKIRKKGHKDFKEEE